MYRERYPDIMKLVVEDNVEFIKELRGRAAKNSFERNVKLFLTSRQL
jgi:hypothetical protein